MSSIKLTADSGGGTFEVKAPASSGNTRVLTLPDAANGTVLTTTNPKTGNILQVVQTVKTDTFSHTGNIAVTDVTGLNVTITPSSNSSKILIQVFMNISNNNISRVQIVRGTTAIALGDAAGSRPVGAASMNNGGDTNVVDPLTMIFLDSPSTTNATTYKVAFSNELNSSTFAVNRSMNDTNNIVGVRSISTITAMEVAA